MHWILEVTRGLNYGEWPLYLTWQLLSVESLTPTSGFRTAGQATSGSAMAGFPGLERKFRRGRQRGKSVCLCRRKENRPRGLETLKEWRYPGSGPAGRGRAPAEIGP